MTIKEEGNDCLAKKQVTEDYGMCQLKDYGRGLSRAHARQDRVSTAPSGFKIAVGK